MLGKHKHGQSLDETLQKNSAPKLAKRSLHKKSSIVSGRTIGAKRERLETANERATARKKDKRKSAFRFFFATLSFLVLAGIAFLFYSSFMKASEGPIEEAFSPVSKEPTIEIIDEDVNSTGGKITSRMKEYIGRVEDCFKERGYQPQKAVIPSSGIREVRIYLEGLNGFIKMIIDRDPAISTEDADRMLRYLRDKGIEEFSYIDVRVDGKAYWK